jgi:DNA-binding transcriptional ArsR family regulator
LELIKKVLSDSPKSKEQLLKITKLPERTLRYNLSKLKKQRLVKEIFMLRDLRRKIFLLNKEVIEKARVAEPG